MAISDNYYDDLAARTTLSDERIAELRDAGVLYDADKHGELLHFFTAVVGDGLFFEVLERRRGSTATAPPTQRFGWEPSAAPSPPHADPAGRGRA